MKAGKLFFILVTGSLFGVLRYVGSQSLNLPSAASSPIDRQLVIGAAIFGVRWGLGGFCPGPALAINWRNRQSL
jgi:uncharacterized membrane protein YedE/YeeE